MKRKYTNIATFIKKNIFIVVLFSMVLKPLHVFISITPTCFSEEVKDTEFDNALDTDSNQEDEQNEEDSKEGIEDFKIITTVDSCVFLFSKTKLLTKFFFVKV